MFIIPRYILGICYVSTAEQFLVAALYGQQGTVSVGWCLSDAAKQFFDAEHRLTDGL